MHCQGTHNGSSGWRCARRASYHSFGQTRRGFPEFASIGILLNLGRTGLGPATPRRSVPLFESGASTSVERPKDAILLPEEIERPLWSVVTAPGNARRLPLGKWVFFLARATGNREPFAHVGFASGTRRHAELAVRGGTRKLMPDEHCTALHPYGLVDLMPR